MADPGTKALALARRRSAAQVVASRDSVAESATQVDKSHHAVGRSMELLRHSFYATDFAARPFG